MLISAKDLEMLAPMPLMARSMVEGFLAGLHKSPFHGYSAEFAEHKAYYPGDATRFIDWRVWGRTDRLVVKKFQEETNMRTVLYLDRSASMEYPLEGPKDGSKSTSTQNSLHLTKARFGLLCAAAILHLSRNQRDGAGLVWGSGDIEGQTQARGGAVHYGELYALLEKFWNRPASGASSDLSGTLHTLAETMPRRSLLVVLSDLTENEPNPESMKEALGHLKFNRHQCVLVHLEHKPTEGLLELPDRPWELVDPETGEKMRVIPAELRKSYQTIRSEYFKQLEWISGMLDMEWVQADITKEFRQVLLPWLIKRQEMAGVRVRA